MEVVNRTYWELGVAKEDDTTETVESFNTLDLALSALLKCKGNNPFIDLWTHEVDYKAPQVLDQNISKEVLLKIINGKFIDK